MPQARLRKVRNKGVMMHRSRVRIATGLCIITLVFRPDGGPVWCFAPSLPGLHAGVAAYGRVRTVRRRAGGPPTAPRVLFASC